MSFTLGNSIKMEVTGASHAPKITVSLSGIPKGIELDMWQIEVLLDRRAGGKSVYTTPRKEKDKPVILSGIENGVTTGDAICAEFINANAKSSDYNNLKFVPRPSHADYAAYVKYDGKIDLSGGGFFSGRMTLPMCFAGAVCKQILEQKGILIGAHMLSVGDIKDDAFNPVEEDLEVVPTEGLPVLNSEAAAKMEELMVKTANDMDSIGGVIECKAVGLPIGLGDPIYDSVESRISYGMFGIPAIKGIEFGSGFDITKMNGSRANDSFAMKDGKVVCTTNHSGGIQGGITNGMPLIFSVAVKPTPSIFKEQKSVDLISGKEVDLKIQGRHDSCIVPRAVPCVEAMCAIILYDILKEFENEEV